MQYGELPYGGESITRNATVISRDGAFFFEIGSRLEHIPDK